MQGCDLCHAAAPDLEGRGELLCPWPRRHALPRGVEDATGAGGAQLAAAGLAEQAVAPSAWR
eukprot:7557339-Lingulodinium_polyedra.AAC.1